ncbi:MAG: OmpA family protein [Campylobacterales bacterium]|nr:OmpA family protein [Campylobacterales bacterium]
MFRRDKNAQSNFWISYADLMAGLLFVFILLIGAIVSKSIILKAHLSEKEQKLELVQKNLNLKEIELKNIMGELELKKSLVDEQNSTIDAKDKTLQAKNRVIAQNKRLLELKEEEIKKLNRLLLQSNTLHDELDKKIVIIQNVLSDTNQSLQKHNKKLKDYENKVVVLSNELTNTKDQVKLKDKKLLELLNALDEKDSKYNQIVAKLQEQRAKIKAFTGMRIKVITELKRELGSKITIDSKSGSLRLSSGILFDVGSARLKAGAKSELKRSFEDYITALVNNPNIAPYLDQIIIEGHTDSDGGYLYNLSLSQDRALAVMNYLLTLDIVERYNIKPLIVSSGRAYMDAIIQDGVEDKMASRRIEIKFRLKNSEAMEEIEKVLDAI